MVDDFCARLGHLPAVRCAFLIDGDSYVRDWCACDASSPLELIEEGPPGWLIDPSRQWSHPQDPMTYSGVVERENEAEALAVLFAQEAEDD